MVIVTIHKDRLNRLHFRVVFLCWKVLRKENRYNLAFIIIFFAKKMKQTFSAGLRSNTSNQLRLKLVHL